MLRPTPRQGYVAALAAVTLIATAVPVCAQSVELDRIEAFARQIHGDVASDDVGGITAAVFRGDVVLWASGFGWADPAARVPAGIHTIYRTGSISKSFTAVAVMRLVEEGVIDLDQPVARRLPEMAGLSDRPGGTAPITYRQLASHTAGLDREPELRGAASGPIDTWEDKILESIGATRFYAPPGQSYRYSNIGFGVLGYAASRASGVPFTVLVRDQIIQPLGMASTTFVIQPDQAARLAVGHANAEDGSVDVAGPAAEHAGRGYKVPNGGVYSTVSDLARFASAVMGRSDTQILAPETRAEMRRVQTPERPDRGYGLGFSIGRTEHGLALVGHGGSVAGYTAYLVFEPTTGYGAVLLRNYNRGRTNLGQAASGVVADLARAALASEGAR